MYRNGRGFKDYGNVDKILNDIQVKLVELCNEIQKEREKRDIKNVKLKNKRDEALNKTSIKINKIFEELGYKK